MERTKELLVALFATLVLGGCASAPQHRADVRDDTTDRVTVGKVQREVRVGMSGAQVAEVLGSPNVVSTDELRREVWIYDKVSTEVVYSASSGGIPALFVGLANGAAISTGGPIYTQQAGAASTTQRTLTIIIKFDESGKVRDFAYHNTQF